MPVLTGLSGFFVCLGINATPAVIQRQMPKEAMDCQRILENIDPYLDCELNDTDQQRVSQHLATCGSCKGEWDSRSTMKNRLKTAASAEAVPFHLESRVRAALHRNPARPRVSFFPRFAVPVAAMLAVGVGLSIAYQLGHLRLTAASQESYISAISEQVPSLMRVGLGDHVHCSVFRKFPKNPPSVAQMAEKLGPEYKDLLPVVSEKMPSDYRVVLGHRCSYHRRKFVHISLTDGSHLVSLVIAKRGSGESFDQSELTAMLADGLPLYRSSVQRFSIAAFQTDQHLVYVVSDLGQDGSANMLASLAPSIRTALRRAEQMS